MTDKNTKRKALGRGLSALMADMEPSNTSEMSRDDQGCWCLFPLIVLSQTQTNPERSFLKMILMIWPDTIAEKGIIQPLIVRNTDE